MLPDGWREEAVRSGAVVPSQPSARVKSAEHLLRLVLYRVSQDAPLRDTAAVMSEALGVVVSPYCVHTRMIAAGGYLAWLVAGLVADAGLGSPATFHGYEPILVDATAFAGRCASGTDARIHAALRLSDLRVVEATAHGVSVGESFSRFQWHEGQLAIGDRGYSNAASIAWVVDHGADVLVRLNRGSTPLIDAASGKKIDVLEWVRAIAIGDVRERAVVVTGRVDRVARTIPMRLVATRLPEKEAEEARQRAREEDGAKVTAATLEMAAYVVLLTTTTIPAAECLELYRMRWQIELLFKRWKSLCHFDRLPNELADSILSWLNGKLLFALLVERLAAEATSALSPGAVDATVTVDAA